jgi:hypothetical protein
LDSLSVTISGENENSFNEAWSLFKQETTWSTHFKTLQIFLSIYILFRASFPKFFRNFAVVFTYLSQIHLSFLNIRNTILSSSPTQVSGFSSNLHDWHSRDYDTVWKLQVLWHLLDLQNILKLELLFNFTKPLDFARHRNTGINYELKGWMRLPCSIPVQVTCLITSNRSTKRQKIILPHYCHGPARYFPKYCIKYCRKNLHRYSCIGFS